MDKQVVKKNSAGALSSLNLRADSGKGAEEIKSDDVSTPILKILHQLSPECNTRSAKHVEGADPGMLYSNSFGQPMDGEKGIEVLEALRVLDFRDVHVDAIALDEPVDLPVLPGARPDPGCCVHRRGE